jgi:hypothetical protein
VTQAPSLLNERDKEVSEACRDIFVSAHGIPSLYFNRNILTEIENEMGGSREDRVRAFDKLLANIESISPSEPEINAFLLGYFASRIAPGSLKHSGVLGEANARYPTAILWYGFWAAMIETDLEQRNNIGITGVDFPPSARRVIREILRPEPILGPPTCDIGYLEFLALSREGSSSFEHILKTNRGSLIVELLPGICTAVNISPKSSLTLKHSEKRKDIVSSIGKQIESLKDTYNKLIAEDLNEIDSEQMSLFFPKRKKTTYQNDSGRDTLKTDWRKEP